MLTRNIDFANAQQDLFDRALFEVLQDTTVWNLVHQHVRRKRVPTVEIRV